MYFDEFKGDEMQSIFRPASRRKKVGIESVGTLPGKRCSERGEIISEWVVIKE